MSDYTKGKIYRLFNDDMLGLVYYGSTTQTLKKRLAIHKYDFNRGINITSSVLFQTDNFKIELVENYPCLNRKELETRERWYIENNECINKYIPGRTHKEWYLDNKDKILEKFKIYNQNNKEKIRENKKLYRENNKDKLAEYHKLYYQNNKDKVKENTKIYYQTNKDKINEYNSTKVTCECGDVMNIKSIYRHRKSQKHLDYLAKKTVIDVKV